MSPETVMGRNDTRAAGPPASTVRPDSTTTSGRIDGTVAINGVSGLTALGCRGRKGRLMTETVLAVTPSQSLEEPRSTITVSLHGLRRVR